MVSLKGLETHVFTNPACVVPYHVTHKYMCFCRKGDVLSGIEGLQKVVQHQTLIEEAPIKLKHYTFVCPLCGAAKEKMAVVIDCVQARPSMQATVHSSSDLWLRWNSVCCTEGESHAS